MVNREVFMFNTDVIMCISTKHMLWLRLDLLYWSFVWKTLLEQRPINLVYASLVKSMDFQVWIQLFQWHPWISWSESSDFIEICGFLAGNCRFSWNQWIHTWKLWISCGIRHKSTEKHKTARSKWGAQGNTSLFQWKIWEISSKSTLLLSEINRETSKQKTTCLEGNPLYFVWLHYPLIWKFEFVFKKRFPEIIAWNIYLFRGMFIHHWKKSTCLIFLILQI